MTKPTKSAGKTQDNPKREDNGQFKKGEQNGTPFEKGNNVGKNGRRNAISDTIRRLGDLDNNREDLLKMVYLLAKGGDMRAIEFIAGYDQGKPKQSIDIEHHEKDELIVIE